MNYTFQNCYEQLVIFMNAGELNSQTLHKALGYAMEIVEFSDVDPKGKKSLVIELLKELASNSSEPELCLSIIDSEYFMNSIDLIVRASSGGLNVNKLLTKTGLFGCLCK